MYLGLIFNLILNVKVIDFIILFLNKRFLKLFKKETWVNRKNYYIVFGWNGFLSITWTVVWIPQKYVIYILLIIY